ncbi:MAG: hypothetical protein ACHQCF_00640 [Solirubrobacterales bacterium]
MERKLDVGASLSEVFSIYGSQAGVLLPVAFCIFLVVGIVDGLLAGSFVLLPLTLAVSVIAATLYQGMVVGLVRDVQDGRRDSTAGELLRAATPVIAPLIGAGLLSGIGIAVGLFLLIVPGLILLTIWAVIAPVIVIERSGVIDAFGRSRELVRGNGWQVFGVVISAFLIALIVGFIFGAIGAGIVHGAAGRIIFNIASSTLTAPITALAAAVIYYRLRAIEGAGAPAVGDAGAAPPPGPDAV